MIAIGILIGIIIGYFLHGLLSKDSSEKFGNVLFSGGEKKILFEFSKSPDDILKYEKIYFSVKDVRKNIDSSIGET